MDIRMNEYTESIGRAIANAGLEIKAIKLSPNTPAGEDQKRVFTPGNAVQDGSSILVIGRAITGPKTPEERLQAGYEVLQDMAKYF